MDYQQTLDYLYSRLPMFHRIGPAAYKADLTNSIKLDQILNYPHQHYPCIHVAGTNGKGSVSHFLASVFQEAGYRTALFTSPHLLDFRERIRVDGEMAEKDFVVEFTRKIRQSVEELNPSFFELTTAMAFQYFAEKQVDVAIIETGLGGRLDSTNVIHPVLAVITNVSLEHTALLGNSLEKIATEKAGIIKENVPVVIGRKNREYDRIFLGKAMEKQAKLVFAEEKYQCRFRGFGNSFALFDVYQGGQLKYPKLKSGLQGDYQAENIATVLTALELLQLDFTKLNKRAVMSGLARVVDNTAIRGRWQVIEHKPLIILDIAHNPDAVEKMLRQLNNVQYQKLHFVLGMSSDKDHQKVLDMLPSEAIYYFCKPDVPRGLDAWVLKNMAELTGKKGFVADSVSEAVQNALHSTNEEDLILISGSAFTVAEAISCLIGLKIFIP